MDQNMSALEAMQLSEREDRVVHLRYSNVLAADLFADCDDTAESGSVVEYWGDSHDADGEKTGEWRVHLHRKGPEQ
jgi:hypothetical protein